jgi:hypothetical protein
MGYKPYPSERNITVSSKQLFDAVQCFDHGSENKCIPRELLDCNKQTLEILFNSLMQGDGNSSGRRYTTQSPQLANDFQELCIKLGKRCTKSFDGACYRLNISNQKSFVTKRCNRLIENYSGMVYDVTVPNWHVIMTRRNGKAVWSGNCGTYDGGREKAPAAICRKVIQAKLSGNHEIEIWGDGLQTRSFMYIDDCLVGTQKLLNSDVIEPINIGSDEMVTINQLVDIVEDIAGIKLKKNYKLDAPKGVRGRSSDNTMVKEVLDWEPSVRLREGMEKTYNWIYKQMTKK